MLSDRFFRIFRSHLNRASFLSATPYIWNDLKNCPEIKDKNYKKYLLFYVIPLALYDIFLLIQFVFERRRGHEHTIPFYYLVAFTLCGLFDLIASLPPALMPYFGARTMDESFNFFSVIQKTYMPTFNPNKSKINLAYDLFLVLCGLGCPPAALIIGIHSILFPNWSIYLTCYLIDDEGAFIVSIGTYALIAFLNAILCIIFLQSIWANLLVGVDILSFIFLYSWLIFQEFLFVKNPSKKLFYRAIGEFRSFRYFKKLYNRFQILYTLYVEYSTPFVVPSVTVMLYISTYCNVSLIKQWNVLDNISSFILIVWALGSAGITAFALGVLGIWYEHSRKVIRSVKRRDWGSRERNREMKKVARGYRTLGFGHGKYYVVKRLTVLKFMKTVSKNTLRALLTFKN